ncbi:MAG: aldehyde dehydrogenase family protein [Parvibaculaceae bacterium]
MFQEALSKVAKRISLASHYKNFIGGDWIAPVEGGYFDNESPITGGRLCAVARSSAADIELALDAAYKAKDKWGSTSVRERSEILHRIADRLEANADLLGTLDCLDNGKPIREARDADLPFTIDHWRYFAGVIRAQEGGISQIDADTVAYHYHEPLGVVGAIIPWNFPVMMASWKLAPALAAGNCIVLKPAEQTPLSVLVMMELIADIVPAGVINVVNGFGLEAGRPLAQSPRVSKISFTGETSTGRLIMQYAAQNLVPVTLELGGKSPNIFFADVADEDDEFFDKAVEGFSMFALNQGETCTCPSRALIHESIFDRFVERAIARTKRWKQGHPLDVSTMIGAQISKEQMDKILSYFEIGRQEGAQVLVGGDRARLGGELEKGYYVQPTIMSGHNKMRVFQEEIFGPVVSVTTFKTDDEALAMANDTRYGLSAGVWTRDINRAYRLGRAIEAGRIWTNCYHTHPTHAAFGGYKNSGIGRENHKMTLDHYQNVKSFLVSYASRGPGFF